MKTKWMIMISLAVVAQCRANVTLQISDQGNGQVQITASGSATLMQSVVNLQYLNDLYITENPWNAGLISNPINNQNPIIGGTIVNNNTLQSSAVYSLRVDDDYIAPNTDFFDIYWSTPLSGTVGDVFAFSFTAKWNNFPVSAVNSFTTFALGGAFNDKFGDQVVVAAIPEPASVMMIALGGLVIAGYRRFFSRV